MHTRTDSISSQHSTSQQSRLSHERRLSTTIYKRRFILQYKLSAMLCRCHCFYLFFSNTLCIRERLPKAALCCQVDPRVRDSEHNLLQTVCANFIVVTTSVHGACMGNKDVIIFRGQNIKSQCHNQTTYGKKLFVKMQFSNEGMTFEGSPSNTIQIKLKMVLRR